MTPALPAATDDGEGLASPATRDVWMKRKVQASSADMAVNEFLGYLRRLQDRSADHSAPGQTVRPPRPEIAWRSEGHTHWPTEGRVRSGKQAHSATAGIDHSDSPHGTAGRCVRRGPDVTRSPAEAVDVAPPAARNPKAEKPGAVHRHDRGRRGGTGEEAAARADRNK